MIRAYSEMTLPLLGKGGFEFFTAPSLRGTKRRGNLIHPLRHSEERIVRRENLIRLLRHCEERFMRRGNLIP
jgi:hypothetical protein